MNHPREMGHIGLHSHQLQDRAIASVFGRHLQFQLAMEELAATDLPEGQAFKLWVQTFCHLRRLRRARCA